MEFCFGLGELSENETDRQWIETVTRNFERIAGEDKQISFEEFKKELNISEVRLQNLFSL